MKSATKQKWDGRWGQLKGRIKQAWGQLTDNDLDVAEGEYEELIGRIEERTGQTREEIEKEINA